MDERVIRVILAMKDKPEASAGSTQSRSCGAWVVGKEASKIFKLMAKAIISISASQKPGTAAKIREKKVTMRSKIEFCLVAEITPKGMPRPTAMIMEMMASSSVSGNRCKIVWPTGRPVWKESPRSPRVMIPCK